MGSVYFRGMLNAPRAPELTYLLEMHHGSPSRLTVITGNNHYFRIPLTHQLCVLLMIIIIITIITTTTAELLSIRHHTPMHHELTTGPVYLLEMVHSYPFMLKNISCFDDVLQFDRYTNQ